MLQFPAPLLKSSLNNNEPTFRVTGTDAGLLAAPGAVTVTVSLNVPVPVRPGLTLTAMEDGAVPDVLPNVSQFCVLLAVQLMLPVPRFATWMLWPGGVKPTAPKNVRLDGVSDNADDDTVNVTGMAIGELLAPGAESVTTPL